MGLCCNFLIPNLGLKTADLSQAYTIVPPLVLQSWTSEKDMVDMDAPGKNSTKRKGRPGSEGEGEAGIRRGRGGSEEEGETGLAGSTVLGHAPPCSQAQGRRRHSSGLSAAPRLGLLVASAWESLILFSLCTPDSLSRVSSCQFTLYLLRMWGCRHPSLL